MTLRAIPSNRSDRPFRRPPGVVSRSTNPRGASASRVVGSPLLVAILLFAAGASRLTCAQDAAPSDDDGTDKATGASPAVVTREFVYESSSFPQCHASTIAQTTDGTLVAAWFGGTREGDSDVGIWLSRKVDGEWSAPVEVADGKQSDDQRFPCWNPVLFQPLKGSLMLFFKVGPSPSRWWGEMMTSNDDGRTWTGRRKLPDDGIGPVKNKPVQLDDGTILCGSSSEHDGWRVHFEMTGDWGQSWSRTEAINDGREISAIQPSILIHPGHRLQALGRSRQGAIWDAWSDDGGKTWSKMELTSLPNPNAGTDAVTLDDRRHLLVYNHTRRGRTPLNVAISDDGKSWNSVLVLEDQPGEYSYPAVIQTRDGQVHVTYTWKRRRIRHVVLDPKQLVDD